MIAAIYANAPYAARGLPGTSNANDGIFDSDTLLTLARRDSAYEGTFNVGLLVD